MLGDERATPRPRPPALMRTSVQTQSRAATAQGVPASGSQADATDGAPGTQPHAKLLGTPLDATATLLGPPLRGDETRQPQTYRHLREQSRHEISKLVRRADDVIRDREIGAFRL